MVTMQETRRMAEEAKRRGQEAQEQAKQAGQDYQNAIGSGFEAASRSVSEINRGFQAIAAEMTDFSKRRFEDVVHTWNQFLRARSFEDIVEVQSRYAQKAYDDYASEMSKVGEMYLGTARSASEPIEQTSRRLT
jgi:hypothetical protein